MENGLTERNRLRVRQLYDAYVGGDMATVMASLTDDVCWTSGDGPSAAPWCGCRNGRAGVEQYFAELAAKCSILDYRVGEIIVDGDRVAVTAVVRARYHHSGAEREVTKVDVIRMRDGQVAEFREYYDTAAMAADLAV
ncbi:nuclear transport factor 2 family protein [Roseomonas terrae]|jgi:ketosteroid isomerase-like protein|uniref:Nuclear transport factor 2 family protein n=1 Tax=Neoroseomonas terrae TaxID=424799 RepID=A0ABS5EFB4_9PROT|nr:nuclear transport factor 2 family protein [Neoroseomonas terrae]MBR0649655.1 nuclear transport factor 2 family protein [Neoroseomonas terrae]